MIALLLSTWLLDGFGRVAFWGKGQFFTCTLQNLNGKNPNFDIETQISTRATTFEQILTEYNYNFDIKTKKLSWKLKFGLILILKPKIWVENLNFD